MIIFHHIPKTAGSTFHHVLSQQYREDETFTINGIKPNQSLATFSAQPQGYIDSLELIKGHLANHFISRINKPYKVIAFVREPLDLFLSSFYYIKRAKHNDSYHKVKNMTLAGFISFREENNYHNPQARHLCGYTDVNNRGALLPINEKRLQDLCEKHIQNIDYLFSVEKFNHALIYLHRELRWEKQPYYVVKNRTSARPDISSLTNQQIQRILALSRVDLFINQYVNERCSTLFDSEIQDHVSRFTKKNKLYSLGKDTLTGVTRLRERLIKIVS